MRFSSREAHSCCKAVSWQKDRRSFFARKCFNWSDNHCTVPPRSSPGQLELSNFRSQPVQRRCVCCDEELRACAAELTRQHGNTQTDAQLNVWHSWKNRWSSKAQKQIKNTSIIASQYLTDCFMSQEVASYFSGWVSYCVVLTQTPIWVYKEHQLSPQIVYCIYCMFRFLINIFLKTG